MCFSRVVISIILAPSRKLGRNHYHAWFFWSALLDFTTTLKFQSVLTKDNLQRFAVCESHLIMLGGFSSNSSSGMLQACCSETANNRCSRIIARCLEAHSTMTKRFSVSISYGLGRMSEQWKCPSCDDPIYVIFHFLLEFHCCFSKAQGISAKDLNQGYSTPSFRPKFPPLKLSMHTSCWNITLRLHAMRLKVRR